MLSYTEVVFPDEDRDKRCAGGHGGMQHLTTVPAHTALSPVLQSAPGSPQTACSR